MAYWVPLQQVAQKHTQEDFGKSPEGLNLPGQAFSSVPVPSKERSFSLSSVVTSLFYFVPTAPCPITGYHWKEPHDLHPFRNSWAFIRSLLYLLQTTQAQASQPLPMRCSSHPCSLLLVSPLHFPVLLELQSPLDSRCSLTRAKQRGRRNSLDLLTTAPLTEPLVPSVRSTRGVGEPRTWLLVTVLVTTQV